MSEPKRARPVIRNFLRKFATGSILLAWIISSRAHADTIPENRTIRASDSLFIGSILGETWDVRQAKTSGYVDCMMPASDVDLTVSIVTPGVVTLLFDPHVYNPDQPKEAGPRWIAEVDGEPLPEIVTIGPAATFVETPKLKTGEHRVRFVQIGNTSGSRRWTPTDPQLSRVTGVSIPHDATLEKSKRATEWFLPITDSIGEGYKNINATRSREGAGAYTNNYFAWPSTMARRMNLSIAGYMISGIGVVRPGIGVPYGALNPDDHSRKNDGWDHLFAGVERPFTTPPKFILLNVGTNEFATDGAIPGHSADVESSRDKNFQANLETFIAAVRDKPQLSKTPLLLSIPFGGFKRTPIQRAVDAYKSAHPEEKHLVVFDIAFGAPDLKTTAGIDEVALFNGLTKNRADDRDTIPSPQAPDRTHPYSTATPAIGSIDANTQIAEVFAARLTAMLNDGTIPPSGPLKAGDVNIARDGKTATITATRATGGSTPYAFQFERSKDDGKTWTKLADPIDSQASTIKPIAATDEHYADGICYRLSVADASGDTVHSEAAKVDSMENR